MGRVSKIFKTLSRTSSGVVIGIFCEPVAANGKLLSMTNEKVITDDFTSPLDYLGWAMCIPITAIVGAGYGAIRGGQLGFKYKDEPFFHSLGHVSKELFTYDPSYIKEKHLKEYTHEKAKELVKGTFISLRTFDSEIFYKKKKRNTHSATEESIEKAPSSSSSFNKILILMPQDATMAEETAATKRPKKADRKKKTTHSQPAPADTNSYSEISSGASSCSL
jgi:hypothetical protein